MLRQEAKPDKVEVHLPESRSICGRSIEVEEGYQILGKRQVFDLPEPKLEVIEHRQCAIEVVGKYRAGHILRV